MTRWKVSLLACLRCVCLNGWSIDFEDSVRSDQLAVGAVVGDTESLGEWRLQNAVLLHYVKGQGERPALDACCCCCC